MNVTLAQAIAIYARASISWFGDKAPEKTGERITLLKASGDSEGAAVFAKVKTEIVRLQSTHRRRETFLPLTK